MISKTKGYEVVLGITPVTSSNFSWDINVNFARNVSEVLKIVDGTDRLTQGSGFLNEYRIEKAEAFGNQYSRGFQRDDQGNILIDASGLPLVTPGKTVKVANFQPDWLAGINNTLTYKDFSLRALIDIRQGGQVSVFTEGNLSRCRFVRLYGAGSGRLPPPLVFGENVFSDENAVLVDEDGNPTGTANNIEVDAEALWGRLGGRNAPVGEAFIRDASNVRLREVVLGYTLPDGITSRLPFRSASVSLVGRNLFFLSNKTEYFDPEAVQSVDNNAEGLNSFSPPTTRSYGVSLNFGF